MSKKIAAAGPKLPYLTDQAYEEEAAILLAEYGQKFDQITVPPVPVDEIVEEHLKLVVEYRDLRSEYPEGDVLGAIWFNEKRIAIDMSMDPEVFPTMCGRYRFTLAHEVGHWRLHRHLYLRCAEQRSFLSEPAEGPDHVFRSHYGDFKETQANRFAACLLMPREMVKRSWHELRGSMDPIYLEDLRANALLEMINSCRSDPESSVATTETELFESASWWLAKRFQVSPSAMRIRLEGMRLLRRKKEPSLLP